MYHLSFFSFLDQNFMRYVLEQQDVRYDNQVLLQREGSSLLPHCLESAFGLSAEMATILPCSSPLPMPPGSPVVCDPRRLERPGCGQSERSREREGQTHPEISSVKLTDSLRLILLEGLCRENINNRVGCIRNMNFLASVRTECF